MTQYCHYLFCCSNFGHWELFKIDSSAFSISSTPFSQKRQSRRRDSGGKRGASKGARCPPTVVLVAAAAPAPCPPRVPRCHACCRGLPPRGSRSRAPCRRPTGSYSTWGRLSISSAAALERMTTGHRDPVGVPQAGALQPER